MPIRRWTRYVQALGSSQMDPARYPASLMEDFLVTSRELGVIGERVGGEEGDIATDELLARFEQLEESDPCANWHWERFTSEHASGIRNPRRVPANVMQQFLDSYATGPFELATDDLVEQVTSLPHKQWSRYMEDLGCSIKDPRRCPASVVKQFLDESRKVGLGATDLATPDL